MWVDVELHWVGGLCRLHAVARPVTRYKGRADYPRLVERLRALGGAGLWAAAVAVEPVGDDQAAGAVRSAGGVVAERRLDLVPGAAGDHPSGVATGGAGSAAVPGHAAGRAAPTPRPASARRSSGRTATPRTITHLGRRPAGQHRPDRGPGPYCLSRRAGVYHQR